MLKVGDKHRLAHEDLSAIAEFEAEHCFSDEYLLEKDLLDIWS